MADQEVKKSTTIENTERASKIPRGSGDRRGLIIGLIVAGVIVLGLVVAAGMFGMHRLAQRADERNQPYFTHSGVTRIATGPGFGYGRTVHTEISDDSVTTTVYNYVTGVITAVNSDNIIIAGNGKQTTIKTNSSTKYINDTKPKVNDTVTVAGTTTDNIITATEINVVNK